MKTVLYRKDLDLVFNPPALGCVLHLPGLPGGGSRIIDRSPYGNDGSITGATWIRLPSGLWCLSFDGNDDYVDCGSGLAFDFTDAITLEAWIKLSALDTTDYVIDKSNRYSMLILNDNKLAFYSNGDAELHNLKGDTVLGQDTWYHAAITYDKDTGVNNLSLFINGQIDKQYSKTAAMGSDPTKTVRVGMYGDNIGPSWAFDGVIALPRVYNHARPALEMQNDFNREKRLFGVW